MIDIRRLINNPEEISYKLKARDASIDVEEIISLYSRKKDSSLLEDRKREELNSLNRTVSKLEQKSTEFAQAIARSKLISDDVAYLSRQTSDLDQRLKAILLKTPNIIQDEVPISYNKEDSIVVSSFGTKREFDFAPQNHVDIVTNLGIIDFNRGAKLAETGFPIYVGKGAVLEFALLQFMLAHHISNGFTFILPPILNNTKTLTNAGNLPKFADQVYSCKDDDLHMIPTSEVPLTGMFSDEVVDLKSGPLRFVAYTPNFRREAGSYGKRDKGLMRIHQFNKVETYVVCNPEHSKEELSFLVKNAEVLLETLGLHYRIANLPSCDLSLQSSQTFDLEIWLPHQDRYSEVSSASNCTDYQARRANIKFKDGAKKGYVHTLNCSGLATPRVMVALLEAYQTKDGHVKVPEALVKYTGFDII